MDAVAVDGYWIYNWPGPGIICSFRCDSESEFGIDQEVSKAVVESTETQVSNVEFV